MNRNYSIDLFRGFAIVGMVLAAVIPWNNSFPAWMYHAQEPPPTFQFNPAHPGITWVDLVFPFFLFAMGAAFPFALSKKVEQRNYSAITFGLLKRFFLLAFFAISIAWLNPSHLNGNIWIKSASGLLTFLAYFMIFLRFKSSPAKRYAIQLGGVVMILLLLYYHSHFLATSFELTNSDVILLILAHTAFFGVIIWLFTKDNVLARLAVITAICGVWLTKDVADGWTASLFNKGQNWKWIFDLSYLKYLCIVLPGSILGDILIKNKSVNSDEHAGKKVTFFIVSFCLVLLVFHMVTLYLRLLTLNVVGHFLLGILFLTLFRKIKQGQLFFYKNLFTWGFALVSIGICFEPWEGGIKKDPSSFSYWFVTAGLAFLFYVVCDSLVRRCANSVVSSSIIKIGQNPMVAYCATAFFSAPLLALLQLHAPLSSLADQSPYLGLIQTIIYMLLMAVVTIFTTNKKWFWRT